MRLLNHNKKEFIISGYCPEINRGGSFGLEHILRNSPNVFKEESAGTFSLKKNLGRVIGFGKNYFTIKQKNYFLKTEHEKIPLKFGRKNTDEEITRIILHLPENYAFGKEVFNDYD